MKSKPMVSIVIATFNAERHLEKCLNAIQAQNYPRAQVEVLLVDGGSTDASVNIGKKYGVKLISNPFRVAEFAKALGIQASNGKYIVILDADNEILDPEWLSDGIKVLEENPNLLGMDPVFKTHREDFWVNRYCAYLQLEDPLVRYMAMLSKNARVFHHGKYGIYLILQGRFPIFGSNGFVWRGTILKELFFPKVRFDEADFAVLVVAAGYRDIGFLRDSGIMHHHVRTLADFVGKRFRRGSEFLYRSNGVSSALFRPSRTWLVKYSKWRIVWAIILCSSFIVPTWESVRGYFRTRDPIWFIHPFMCIITLVAYGLSCLAFRFQPGIFRRPLQTVEGA